MIRSWGTSANIDTVYTLRKIRLVPDSVVSERSEAVAWSNSVRRQVSSIGFQIQNGRSGNTSVLKIDWR